jgi:predicted RNase H-like HicB family nuclease
MTKDAKLYTTLPYAVEVVPDVTTEGDPCFLARHPELPGCMSHGWTPEEALANLNEARDLYIESLLEDGVEPPLPAQRAQRSAVWRISVRTAERPSTGGPRQLVGGGIAPLAALSR